MANRLVYDGQYIIATSTIDNVEEDDRINSIERLLRHQPSAPEGFVYYLRSDLEWELCELPPEEDIPVPPTPEEILSRLEAIL